ncbi:MAG: hypothetical protein ABF293_09345 [Flavobacteriaceae bacterium]
MDITIYYLLAGLAVIYIAVRIYNRKESKRRKSRKFMEGYKRRDRSEDKGEN